MRPGEISALNVEDLLCEPAGVLITVRRSKTDPDAQGQLVGVVRGDNRLTDPIRAGTHAPAAGSGASQPQCALLGQALLDGLGELCARSADQVLEMVTRYEEFTLLEAAIRIGVDGRDGAGDPSAFEESDVVVGR